MLGDLTRYQKIESRSASFENPTGERGKAGAAASYLGPTRKGAAWKGIAAGETVVLADIDGPGMIRHIWMTLDLNHTILRGCVIRAYWDGSDQPSVECPVGDFFGIAHGRTNHFFNVLQAMQEGSGLNCYFQMPFARGARLTFSNETDQHLGSLYYSVDYTIGDPVDDDTLRFHSSFRRENPTTMKQDFVIMPQRHGRGRFLGCGIGVRTRSPQRWGGGEDKGYLDGKQMAGAFQMLNSRDLIWSRRVREYLLGERQTFNDLMAWNADTTRMPARMHHEYLTSLYLHNALATSSYRVEDHTVSLSDIHQPVFMVGTQRDHISPWRSVYKLHHLCGAEITFVLASGGHNAGIISEPGHPHRSFQSAIRPAYGPWMEPEQWAKQAKTHEGSWWPAWQGPWSSRGEWAPDRPWHGKCCGPAPCRSYQWRCRRSRNPGAARRGLRCHPDS